MRALVRPPIDRLILIGSVLVVVAHAGPVEEPPPVAPVAAAEPPPPALAGIVVDAAGRPVAGVTIAVSEPVSSHPWIPPAVAGSVESSQYPLAAKTGADGRFAWVPVREPPWSIVAIAPDGRVAAVATSDPRARLTLHLAAPARIQVTCADLPPRGAIALATSHLRFGAACGETVGGLPPAIYELGTRRDAGVYAGLLVEAFAGQTVEGRLAVRPPGTIEGQAVAYPGGRAIAGAECRARWLHGETDLGSDPSVTADRFGRFALTISRGPWIAATCEAEPAFARGVAQVDLSSGTAMVNVRMVKRREAAVPAGVQIAAERGGARILRVDGLARRAGLRRGDLVEDVDGVPLAGLTREAMVALAFELAPVAVTRWAVRRGNDTLAIRASFP